MSLPCNSEALTVKLPHLWANWLNTAIKCANTWVLNYRHTKQVYYRTTGTIEMQQVSSSVFNQNVRSQKRKSKGERGNPRRRRRRKNKFCFSDLLSAVLCYVLAMCPSFPHEWQTMPWCLPLLSCGVTLFSTCIGHYNPHWIASTEAFTAVLPISLRDESQSYLWQNESRDHFLVKVNL